MRSLRSRTASLLAVLALTALALCPPPLARADEGVGDALDALDDLLEAVSTLRASELARQPGGIDAAVEKLRADFGRLRIQGDHALRDMKATGAKDGPEVEALRRRHGELARQAEEAQAAIALLQALARPPDATLLGVPDADGVPWEDVDAVASWIDGVLEKVQSRRGIAPAGPIDDSAFLRRASIDIAGAAPAAELAASYRERDAATRRAWLIDELVASPGYAESFAAYWNVELLGRGYLPDDKHRAPFVDWLRKVFAENLPHDRFVAELVANTKTTTKEASPTVFLAARQSDAVANTNKIAGTFLGLQVECAECHDDPYQPWTQDDYHSLVAFLARQRERDTGGNVYVLEDRDQGEARYQTPDGRKLTASMRYVDGARFSDHLLDAEGKPVAGEDGKTARDPRTRREMLVEAMRRDPQLARAQVNRMWAQLLGRGIVEPIERFTQDNAPSVPLVLDALADKFRRSGFDNRWLIRVLARTRAYAVAAGAPRDAGGAPPESVAASFARFPFKALTAEQMAASILAVTGRMAAARDDGERKALARARDDFIEVYAWEPDKIIDPDEGTIPQTLALLNSRLVIEACEALPGTLAARALAAPPAERVDLLWDAALSRAPSAAERERAEAHLARAAGDADAERAAVADLIWSLINTAEFRYNH